MDLLKTVFLFVVSADLTEELVAAEHCGERVPPLLDVDGETTKLGDPHEPWKGVWEKMLRSGWTWRCGSGLMLDYYYIKPGSKIGGGVEGQDYFVRVEDVQKFAVRNYGWRGVKSSAPVINCADGEPDKNIDEECEYDYADGTTKMGNEGLPKGKKGKGKSLVAATRPTLPVPSMIDVFYINKNVGAHEVQKEKRPRVEKFAKKPARTKDVRAKEDTSDVEDDGQEPTTLDKADGESTFSQSGFRAKNLFLDECRWCPPIMVYYDCISLLLSLLSVMMITLRNLIWAQVVAYRSRFQFLFKVRTTTSFDKHRDMIEDSTVSELRAESSLVQLFSKSILNHDCSIRVTPGKLVGFTIIGIVSTEISCCTPNTAFPRLKPTYRCAFEDTFRILAAAALVGALIAVITNSPVTLLRCYSGGAHTAFPSLEPAHRRAFEDTFRVLAAAALVGALIAVITNGPVPKICGCSLQRSTSHHFCCCA